MPAGVTYQELFRVPHIMGTVRRVHAPGSTLCDYYGVGIAPRVPVQNLIGRNGQYDLFDSTRSLAYYTAPMAGFIDVNRKPVGSQPISIPRMANSISIMDEEIFGTRSMGSYGPATVVPVTGNQYYVNQVKYLKTRMNNNHEFIMAHIFRGGFKLKPFNVNGSQTLVLVPFTDTTAGAISNASLVPTENTGDVDGIFSTYWDDPSCDVIEQFMLLQKRAAQINGRRITEVWMNGTTGHHLFKNVVLQAVGGSVYQIFSTLQPNKGIAPDQKFPDTGVTVVFRGLPDIKFHIYNQGYVTPGTSEHPDAQTGANWTPFIPDGKAIMTPPPGDWMHVIRGSEPVQWNLTESMSRTVYGFGFGTERAINPPRTVIKMLDNSCPAIVEPAAAYYVDVLDPS
jgi:hypothetical protein